MAALPESARAVIEGPGLAHLVTLEPDGRPQVSVLWVGLDGGQGGLRSGGGDGPRGRGGRDRPPYTHAQYREHVTEAQVRLLHERAVWAPSARSAATGG